VCRRESTNANLPRIDIGEIDDPGLDTRLSFIRKSGGLDSRAALFVLSPVSPSELLEFIQRLVFSYLQRAPTQSWKACKGLCMIQLSSTIPITPNVSAGNGIGILKPFHHTPLQSLL
jgi:hypothetical protein